MVTIRYFDPAGAAEARQPHAPRLAGLAGKRIAFVSNDKWQAYRILPRLRALLAADFADVVILDETRFAQGNTALSGEAIAAAVCEAGVDAAIVGNAA